MEMNGLINEKVINKMIDPTLKELIEKNKKKRELDLRIKNLICLNDAAKRSLI